MFWKRILLLSGSISSSDPKHHSTKCYEAVFFLSGSNFQPLIRNIERKCFEADSSSCLVQFPTSDPRNIEHENVRAILLLVWSNFQPLIRNIEHENVLGLSLLLVWSDFQP
ncbi:hypothetical protein AVEN_225760-1 [Araneus ventricosus]|uniref:Uncharacterized protein n=1 Tax=Araneus ventricosus TaxID=182803 RepID=A0A4Y2N8X7_ARAVE|nr:hypothetical protein AVEN_225760-1 [Araneus ventricosus]